MKKFRDPIKLTAAEKRLLKSPRVKRIVDFAQMLHLPESTPSKPINVRLLNWELKFIANVYGPMNKSGNRKVRRAVLSIARKNGKTLLVAILVMIHLFGPEAGRNKELYAAANSRDQASQTFKYAAAMIRNDDYLSSICRITDSTKQIACVLNGNLFKSVSKEAATAHGKNPAFVIYDELAQSKNYSLYEAFDTAFGAQPEGLMITISTQAENDGHLLSQLIDGYQTDNDESTYSQIHAADPDDDMFDPATWIKANPGLGFNVSIDDFESQARAAEKIPSAKASFSNLRLNMRIQSGSSLVQAHVWRELTQKISERELFKPGESVILALDMSQLHDLTSLVMLSAGDDNRVTSWFWKPRDVILDQEQNDRVPYRAWAESGHLLLCHGRSIDHADIAAKIIELCDTYDVQVMTYDRLYVKALIKSMGDQGLSVSNVIESQSGRLLVQPYGQGFVDMGAGVSAFHRAVLDGTLKISDNPVMTWCVSNAKLDTDASGNQKPIKHTDHRRIDGAVALCMAMGHKSRAVFDAPIEASEIISTRRR